MPTSVLVIKDKQQILVFNEYVLGKKHHEHLPSFPWSVSGISGQLCCCLVIQVDVRATSANTASQHSQSVHGMTKVKMPEMPHREKVLITN